MGAYDLLARMRVELFRSIRRLAPAYLVEREKGDLMNIAVSDIETIEFFFAHTIGPMFTVILLPCVTLGLALSHPASVRGSTPAHLCDHQRGSFPVSPYGWAVPSAPGTGSAWAG